MVAGSLIKRLKPWLCPYGEGGGIRFGGGGGDAVLWRSQDSPLSKKWSLSTKTCGRPSRSTGCPAFAAATFLFFLFPKRVAGIPSKSHPGGPLIMSHRERVTPGEAAAAPPTSASLRPERGPRAPSDQSIPGRGNCSVGGPLITPPS